MNMRIKNTNTINVGTIGHVDHGKTTLTAAITKTASLLDPEGNRFVNYAEIDKAPEEKTRGITINSSCVTYRTPGGRRYSHTDCPGHADYVKNMITGARKLDIAILVVAATDSVMPQTREHVSLAKQMGIKNIVVFVNKTDVKEVDEEMRQLVEMDVEGLLESYGYIDKKIIFGSASKALEGSDKDRECIIELMEAIDVLEPRERDADKPFLMPIEGKHSITGRGLVATGCVEQGTINLNDKVDIVGLGKNLEGVVVTGIETHNTSLDKGLPGANVGLLLRGVKIEQINRGQVMVQAGTGKDKLSNSFCANVYLSTEDEGGRNSGIAIGRYEAQFYTLTASITGRFECLCDESGKPISEVDSNGKRPIEMKMPGDHFIVKVMLGRECLLYKDMVITIRESGKTIAQGTILKVLPKAVEQSNRKR